MYLLTATYKSSTKKKKKKLLVCVCIYIYREREREEYQNSKFQCILSLSRGLHLVLPLALSNTLILLAASVLGVAVANS